MDTQAFTDALVSHAMTLGQFEKVNAHEPKQAPPGQLTAAVWIAGITSWGEGSGLASTTAVATYNIRVYQGMITEPQDMIDPNMSAAVDKLMNAYSGDFTLGGTVMGVDLLGMAGTPMSMVSGYQNQDGRVYRVMTVTVPLIIADAWVQAA